MLRTSSGTKTKRKTTSPTTVNATLGGAGVAATSAAAKAARRGGNPARAASRAAAAYGPSGTSSTTSTISSSSSAATGGAATSRAAKRAARAKRRERAAKQAAKTAARVSRYEPPKLVSKEIKTRLRKIEGKSRQRALRNRIEVQPELSKPVKVKRNVTLVSGRVARKAVERLPKPQRQQAAQRLRARAPQPPTPPPKERPKIEGPREKAVARRLEKAAKRASNTGLAKKLDRAFGPNETISSRETAIVAEAYGLPGITYAKAIAPGESGNRPGVPNPDDATPSLFQITPSVQSAETQAKFDRIAAKHPGGYSNPIVAAKQARVLAKGSSDAGVSNYVAFDPSAPQGHLPGGQKRARKILYGEPKPIPKETKQQAKRVLGKQATKRVIKEAREPAGPTETKPPPAKEVREWITLAESKGEVAAEQGVKESKAYKSSVRNMAPELQRALVALGKRTGTPVQINEGYRTTKRANEFPSGTASRHHAGLAADVNNNSAYSAEDLAAVGLTNTAVSGEPWHFELVSPPSGGVATISGGVSSGGSIPTGAASQALSGAPTASQTTSRRTSKRDKRRKVRRRPNTSITVTPIPENLSSEDYQVEPDRESYSEYVKRAAISLGL